MLNILYEADRTWPYKVSRRYDPDDKLKVKIIFRPDPWTTATIYKKTSDWADVVLPTTYTGQYHRVKASGKSGATEPTWAVVAEGETTDGTTGLTWEAFDDNLLPASETITTVTFAGTNSTTVSGSSNTTISCTFTIDALPAAAETAGEFEIKFHATKSTGEEFDGTLHFVVDER